MRFPRGCAMGDSHRTKPLHVALASSWTVEVAREAIQHETCVWSAGKLACKFWMMIYWKKHIKRNNSHCTLRSNMIQPNKNEISPTNTNEAWENRLKKHADQAGISSSDLTRIHKSTRMHGCNQHKGCVRLTHPGIDLAHVIIWWPMLSSFHASRVHGKFALDSENLNQRKLVNAECWNHASILFWFFCI